MYTGDKEMQILYDLPEDYKNIARYMWNMFTDATRFRLEDYPEIQFAIQPEGVFPISRSFKDIIHGDIRRISDRYHLPEGLAYFREEEPVACAFYLINSLHETLLPSDKFDKYSRYPYQASIQYSNNLMEVNYVQEIFDELYKNIVGHLPVKEPTKLLHTHDIDYLYSAWKVDLLLALRKYKFQNIPRILYQSLFNPHRWNNIDHILRLEKEYDIQSIFFWLTEKGKAGSSANTHIDHADYSFRMKSLSNLWKKINKAGSWNGLHKSAFKIPIEQELIKLPEKAIINRNHFLKFHLPDHYDQLEASGLLYDSSLGFAEHHGFRNSYGRPFQPYNIHGNKPYRFTEYPLHIMDTTFLTYMKLDLETAVDKIKSFIRMHPYSCILTVLLHNSNYSFKDTVEMKIWHEFYQSMQRYECMLPEES